MAEKIIQDLRNTGNESLDALINMVKNYQMKQVQTQQEIHKLRQLVLMKEDEITGLDEDIRELSVTLKLLIFILDFRINSKRQARG